MKYWYQQPDEALSGYVRTILVLEGSGEPVEGGLPLFTNGLPVLICQTMAGDRRTQTISHLSLYGKSAPAETWNINENSSIVAYFFKPFTMASVFNIPATALAKNPVELSNWDPHKTNALRTQILYADTVVRRIEILDNLLKHLLQENARECEIVRYATDYIMLHPGKESLAVVLKELSLTERTFQRVFKKYVGVTASQYRRICQFQFSFSQVKGKNFDKLADVAYDNGFADQSHFIRAFKEFTEITPNDYLKNGLNGAK